MSVGSESFQFRAEPEAADIQPARVTGSRHRWRTKAGDVDIAALALPSAEQRTDEYRVRIDVETDRGTSEMSLPLRVERRGENGGSEYRVVGTQYQLSLQFDLRPNSGEIRWTLEPGGHDAASRAAILDLLVAISGTGSLVLWDSDFGALARISLIAQSLDPSIYEERRFLTDVLAIEAWTGLKLPIPDDVDDQSASLVAQLAYWMRSRRMRVRFSTISTLTQQPADTGDELRLHEYIEYKLFGVMIPLGRVNYRVRVRALSSAPEGDLWRTEFRATDEWVTATITPPRGPWSIRALRTVDAGGIPKLQPFKRTRRGVRAHQVAQQLVGDWEEEGLGDDKTRDEIRRRWPT